MPGYTTDTIGSIFPQGNGQLLPTITYSYLVQMRLNFCVLAIPIILILMCLMVVLYDAIPIEVLL